MEHIKFPKIPRLNKDMVISEKIDGTNANILIQAVDPSPTMREDFLLKGWAILKNGSFEYAVVPGSKNRFVTLKKDNYAFARWVFDNSEELLKFGPGRHYGEWWGCNIQRNYGQAFKRFSMFHPKWEEQGPDCVDSVPILYEGPFSMHMINLIFKDLESTGSTAAPGFDRPEGIIVFHTGAGQYFKYTLDGDGHKGDR
jgi:hypothetical protein